MLHGSARVMGRFLERDVASEFVSCNFSMLCASQTQFSQWQSQKYQRCMSQNLENESVKAVYPTTDLLT